MTEKILKFPIPLFYLANKEIQQKTERENSKYICYFEFFRSGFPHLQNKRVGISKKFLSFSTLFLYIPWKKLLIKGTNLKKKATQSFKNVKMCPKKYT